MATQTVPQRATAPTARNAESTGDATPFPFTDWRSAALAVLNSALECADAARRIAPDACPATVRLVCEAELVAERGKGIPTGPSAKPYEMIDVVWHLHALLKGASALDETPLATRLLLTETLDRLDAAVGLFDVGGLPETGLPAAASTQRPRSDSPPDSPSGTPRPGSCNSEHKSPTLAEVRRASYLFDSIMSLSSAIQTMCVDIVEDATDDDLANRAVAAKALAAQVGFFAEMGQQDIAGYTPSRHSNGAEWLLPPVFREVSTQGATL